MFIERLLNQGNAPPLERTLEFTAARRRLIAENVVNVDTPDSRAYEANVTMMEVSKAMLNASLRLIA